MKVVKSGIYWHTLKTTTVLPQFQVKPDLRGWGPAGPPCISAECGLSVVISLTQLVPVHSCLSDSNPGSCVFTQQTEPSVGLTFLYGNEMCDWTLTMDESIIIICN